LAGNTSNTICFHGIGVPGRALDPGEDDYWVSHEAFLRVLDEVATWPGVRLTFDDGNRSDVERALPALQERGLDATFFVLAGRLDEPGSLSAEDVRSLRDAGMRVGTHGMHHVPWRRLDAATAARELHEARGVLAEALGEPVTEAACPFGEYDRRALSLLREAGYDAVYTSDRRPARARGWLQPRYTARRQDTAESLRREVLEGGLRQRAVREAVGVVKRWR
jgi:peptidoglycan/xylan/chitin deacetylase (PgdA/CDA1 family)